MENYFWNTEEENSIKKLYILVIYDIVDNKRRVRFAKKMNGYGFRVQNRHLRRWLRKIYIDVCYMIFRS